MTSSTQLRNDRRLDHLNFDLQSKRRKKISWFFNKKKLINVIFKKKSNMDLEKVRKVSVITTIH